MSVSTDELTCATIVTILAPVAVDSAARFAISLATTAKPLPWSPALAASIEAFKESSVVSSAISWIAFASSLIFSTCFASVIAFSDVLLIES